MTMIASNFFIIIVFLFIPVGMIFDITLKNYKYTNKYLNYFLVFVMIFGHPLYFSFSLFISIYLDKYFLEKTTLYDELSFSGYVILVVCGILFALLRYFLYKKIFKNTNNIYQYSRFYIFTFLGISLYLSMIGVSLEFYLVYMYQTILPVLVVIVLVYSVIKFSILKWRNKK